MSRSALRSWTGSGAGGGVVRRLTAARALRGFGDGLVSVLLVAHLRRLGFGPVETGAVVTGTLLGSAALTLAAGLLADRLSRRRVLLAACAAMAATGAGFVAFSRFWPILLVAVVGTLNPSAGDVSVFSPTEQAFLATTVDAPRRPAAYARYNVAGTLAAALGALASGALSGATRWGFVAYASLAVAVAALYRGLPPDAPAARRAGRPLERSRGVVLRLAALFSLDSAASGLVTQSLLVLWLFRRFGLSVEAAGAVFFAAGVLSAGSQLLSARLAGRIGLVPTMVFTHLPANLLLVGAAVAPSALLAVGLLLARAALSQMDVPARQALVMSLVPPEERAAAASVTNVPRGLAAATTPLLAGLLLERSSFGWPLVGAGLLKVAYDLALLVRFGARSDATPPPVATGPAG